MCQECERARNATYWYVARRARVTMVHARSIMSGSYSERIMDHANRYGVERIFELINPFLNLDTDIREEILEHSYDKWGFDVPERRSLKETQYINGDLVIDPEELCAMEYIRREIDTPIENFDYERVWEILEEAVFGYFKLDWGNASAYVANQLISSND